MALTDCLTVALEGKEISKADYNRLVKRFEQLNKRYEFGGTAGPGAPERVKQALLDELTAETAHQKRKAKLAVLAMQGLQADLARYRTASGKPDAGEAGILMLEHFGEAPFDSVAFVEKEIIATAHGRMGALLDRFRRGALRGDAGRHHKAQLPNIVREAFGEDSGDVMAKGFAAAWLDTAEWLRLRFNAAGGAIGKLENWGLPQHHDAAALLSRELPQWKADIKPLLDTTRMRHPLTDTPVMGDELDEILDSIFHGITSDGWDTRKPTMQPFGRGALANQHAEHRFLVFKNADAWLQYQRNYGGGSDVFQAMMAHINRLARDIAAMERFGPNPNGGIAWLKQAIAHEGGKTVAGEASLLPGKPKKIKGKVQHAQRRIDEIWGSMRGTLNTPADETVAGIGAGTRNVITASVLGGATLSSVSDLGTARLARSFAGVRGSVIGDAITSLTPAGRRDAVSAGLIMDSAMHVFHQQARYVGNLDGTGITAYLADRVLTYSGLTPWTQAMRHSFGLGYMHELARRTETAWAAMPKAFKRRFEAYGLGEKEWNFIRRGAVHKGESGLTLLRPRDVDAIDPDTARRYHRMILAETEYAVPSGGHRSRTLLLGKSEAGTLGGEILRSFAQFRSFAATYAMLYGQRIAREVIGRQWGLLAVYGGAVLISSIMFGALAKQMKTVSAGKDPEPMNTPAFWAAAFLQGGGLGLFGDFLFAETNRYGGGIAETVAGATAAHLGDFAALTSSGVALLTGQENKFGKELVKFLRGNVPGGNIWYLRAAWERNALDQLQWVLDPDANKAFKRRQQDQKRDYGNGYWWRPGQRLPDRMPQVSSP